MAIADTARNMALEVELVTVLETLGAAGVEAVVLKGVPLLRRAFGRLDARPVLDNDLLVHRADVRRAHAVLIERGYREHPARATRSGSAEWLSESSDGGEKAWEVVVDGGANDRVRGIEVVVCEPVAHPGDIHPRNIRLAGEDVRTDALYRFTDLDEPYAHRVVDQAVVQIAAIEVALDRGDGVQDVGQSSAS